MTTIASQGLDEWGSTWICNTNDAYPNIEMYGDTYTTVAGKRGQIRLRYDRNLQVRDANNDLNFIVSGASGYVGIGGITTPDYHLEVNGTISGTGLYAYWISTQGGLSPWQNADGGGIYYDGEVKIGKNNDWGGDYHLQVSGATIFSGAITFIGELSGLAAPAYSSAAVNKGYADRSYTRLHSSKPADASLYSGQIIRVSGGSTEGTWIFMSVRNTSDGWEWVQLGMST
jgi:hypothetical protein